MTWSIFWPGFRAAWFRGASIGLLIAVLWTWWLCVTILATLVWQHWWPPLVTYLSWGGVITAALAAAGWESFRPAHHQEDDAMDLLVAAQDEYLRGNWFEAEALALRLLHRCSDDIPAGLLLVGVLRATGRLEAAQRRLDQLQLYDAAGEWWFEIRQEAARIERAREVAAAPEDGQAESADSST
ncbi:MAG: hypothetical protein KatS3mg111_1835 [Pirellulaceae bacterium]|nr:MAG: hypothetical protein KatS3mg111_1835 [Pirellulaceae bacterium]